MAFNPFASFRKHQKYWMAGAVLVCMVTFVLCSGGMKGTGLDDVLLHVFRKKGNEYVRVNNRGYTYEDITRLKEQRAVANDFMRATTKVAIDELEPYYKDLLKDPKTTSKDKDDASVKQHSLKLNFVQTCLSDLHKKYSTNPRYFRGGTKLDDLIEFIYWRDLADKYNVQISDAMVRELVNHSVHAPLWGFGPEKAAYIERQIGNSHNASSDAILRAIKEEFRVQIVQLAVLGQWSTGPLVTQGISLRDLYAEAYPRNGYPAFFLNMPMEMRICPTPEQISAQYKKVRTELTIDLLPVSLEELAKKEELPKDPAEKLKVLQEFYNKYAKNEYNPTSETPGFIMPMQAEIQFINAHADMPYYKTTAAAVARLRKTPPPVFGPLTGMADYLGWLADSPADLVRLQGDLDSSKDSAARYRQQFESWYLVLKLYHKEATAEPPGNAKTEDKVAHAESKKQAMKLYEQALARPPEYKYAFASWLTPHYWETPAFWTAIKEAKPTPAAVHDLLGALSRPDGAFAAVPAYAAVQYQAQFEKYKPVIAADRGKREAVGAQILLAQTSPFGADPFTAAGLTYYAGVKEQVMPVAGTVEEELRTKVEEKLAQEWVKQVMLDAKRTLEAVKGKREPFEEAVRRLQDKYSRDVVVTDKDGKKSVQKVSGIERGTSDMLRNQYDVEQDQGLKALRDAYMEKIYQINTIEGRQGRPEQLREGDFNKLFFVNDPIGAAQYGPFTPKVWPPYVSIPKDRVDPLLPDKAREVQRLFDEDRRPFIFWLSEKVGSRPLKFETGIQSTMDFVEQQYRLFHARAKLLAKLKEVVAVIRDKHRGEGDVVTAMENEAKKLGTQLIVLDHVSILVENKNKGPQDPVSYVDYTLGSREKFLYPREDVVKQLLALNNLKAPLVIEPKAAEKEKGISYKELNDLNAELFVKNYKQAKIGQLQILTNKPRTVYYIALVTDVREPPPFAYFADVLPGAMGSDSAKNDFVDRVQQDMGQELLKLTVQAMRDSDANYFVSDDAKKQFAESTDSGQ